MQRTFFIVPWRRMLQTAGYSLASILVVTHAWAADTPEERATLKGLRSIHPMVVTTQPDRGEAFTGLLTTLTADLELRLRTAGIGIDTSSAEHLFVVVDVFRSDDRTNCHVTVAIELWQFVILARNDQRAYSPTWSTYTTGWGGCVDFEQFTRERTRDIVDKFLNAYLEQNPKQ